MTEKEEILKLKHGEKYIIPEEDYGKAEVWLINDRYFLFEIPWLGGDPVFRDVYHNTKNGIDSIIKEINSWE